MKEIYLHPIASTLYFTMITVSIDLALEQGMHFNYSQLERIRV